MIWIDEVKEVQKQQNITYKEALKVASSRRKPGRVEGKPGNGLLPYKEAMKLASSRRQPGLVGGSLIRRDYPPSVREFIKKNGEKQITKIIVQRVPLAETLDGFLNVLTLGQYGKAKKKAGYDDLFHLSMLVWLNGKKICIEKNEVLSIGTKIPPMKKGGSQMEISITQPLTLNELLNRAYEKRGDQMFVYDAQKNNCQDFIILLLRSSNLLTPEAEQFIKQDAESIFKRMPGYTADIARGLTDMAAIGNVIIHGQGVK